MVCICDGTFIASHTGPIMTGGSSSMHRCTYSTYIYCGSLCDKIVRYHVSSWLLIETYEAAVAQSHEARRMSVGRRKRREKKIVAKYSIVDVVHWQDGVERRLSSASERKKIEYSVRRAARRSTDHTTVSYFLRCRIWKCNSTRSSHGCNLAILWVVLGSFPFPAFSQALTRFSWPLVVSKWEVWTVGTEHNHPHAGPEPTPPWETRVRRLDLRKRKSGRENSTGRPFRAKTELICRKDGKFVCRVAVAAVVFVLASF